MGIDPNKQSAQAGSMTGMSAMFVCRYTPRAGLPLRVLLQLEAFTCCQTANRHFLFLPHKA